MNEDRIIGIMLGSGAFVLAGALIAAVIWMW